MTRRAAAHDYSRPGTYHITLHVAEGRGCLLGTVVGDPMAADGSPEAPRVELLPVGQMVEYELLTAIHARYPMVDVQDHVVMPDHLHALVVVTAPLKNKAGKSTHLGQVIAGFKYGCTLKYRTLLGKRLAEPADTLLAGQGAAVCPSVTPTGVGVGKKPVLFQEGYCDVMPVDEAQLATQRAYIQGNPRSRLLRMAHRDWLTARRGGIPTGLTISALMGYLRRECAPSQATNEALEGIAGRLLARPAEPAGTVAGKLGGTGTDNRPTESTGTVAGKLAGTVMDNRPAEPAGTLLATGTAAGMEIVCDSYGDRALLEHRLLPVVCHRKDKTRFAEQKRRCLEEAQGGTVLVSPRIAKGEQEIIDAAVDEGYPVVLVADNGFHERYHPSAVQLDRCAAGRLLLVSPWRYRYRLKGEAITVAECKTMNCIAQALCHQKDSWWKNNK